MPTRKDMSRNHADRPLGNNKTGGYIDRPGHAASLLALVFLPLLIVLAAGPPDSWAKANMSGLKETPKDRTTTATDPEYSNLQSYVYDGFQVSNDGTPGAADCVLALGAGGLVSFANGITDPSTFGMLAREEKVNFTGEDENLYVTRAVAEDSDETGGVIGEDRVFILSGSYVMAYQLDESDGSLTSLKRVRIYDPENASLDYLSTGLTIVDGADTGGGDDYVELAISARRQDGTGGAVFLIRYDAATNNFDLDAGAPDFDVLSTGFVPNAVKAVNANIDGTGPRDYLFIVGVDNLCVRYITLTDIGGTSTSDAFNDVSNGTFDGTGRDVAIYANSAVDGASVDDEALVFVGTNNGLIAYELDYSGGYELEERGNLTEVELSDLDIYGVAFDDAGTASGKAGWLVVTGGTGGMYVLETSGGNDELALTSRSRIDTTGMTVKPFWIDPTTDDSDIPHIHVADGGGGFKDFAGTNMDDATREITLEYQWDESVAAVAVKILEDLGIGNDDLAVVLDMAGGIKIYDVEDSTAAPEPQMGNGTVDGKLGLDIAWSSVYNAEGSGTQLAGTAHDLWAAPRTGTTDVDIFVAGGEAGIKKMHITAVDDPANFVIENSGNDVESYNTPGTAKGVDAIQTAAGQFYVAVADGDGGTLLMDFNITNATAFTLQRQVALQGSGVAEDVLVDKRTGDSFVHVAYGDRGLLILDTGNSTFSDWSNPSQEVLIDSETLGGYAMRLALGDHGSDTYYLYVLVHTATEGNKIVVLNVSTPSSAQVVGTYSGEPEANNLAWVKDDTNTRYYLVLSSYGDSELGQTSQLVTVNVSDPALPLGSSAYGVTGQARCVDAIDTGAGGAGLVVVGESQQVQTENSYAGYVGRAEVGFTGAKTVTVSVSANPTVVSLGGIASLNTTVSGGESPYAYRWSATARTSTETGTFSNEAAQAPTWTSPAGVSDLFTLTVDATDNDGNSGSSSVTVRARPTGVSVVNRIGKAGSTVGVPIEISGVASRSIDAWGLDVTFDPLMLVFTGVSTPSDLTGWQITGQEVTPGLVRMAGYAESFDAVIEPGATKTLININFSITHEGSPGTIVNVTPSNAVDDIQGVDLSSGSFKLVCPGDVDGSGTLTPQDAMWTFYYFLGVYDLEDDEAKVGDVNNNGMVDLSDAVEIMNRYVAYGGSCSEF
jgi:hypothetical protein